MPRSQSDATRKSRKPSQPEVSAADVLATTNWEKRLELARTKRNRVLEGKAGKSGKPVAAPSKALSQNNADNASPVAPESEATVARAPGPTEAVATSPAPSRTGFGALQVGMIATTCSLALGLGLGLGLGVDLGRNQDADVPQAKAPETAALSTTMTISPLSGQTFALTDITELSAPLPPAQLTFAPTVTQAAQPPALPDPEPIVALAAPDTPLIAPASPQAPAQKPAPIPTLSLFWEIAKPLAPQEVAAVEARWSEPPAPRLPSAPEPAGIFDASARLVPLEAAPVPLFSLAEKLFAPGSELEATKLFVFAPAALPPAAIDAQLETLKATGLETANLQRIPLTISTAHLRYYTPQDAPVAAALGETLGLEARDFTGQVAGVPGRIEVWLQGRSGRPAAKPEERQANGLFGGIIRLFQRNE